MPTKKVQWEWQVLLSKMLYCTGPLIIKMFDDQVRDPMEWGKVIVGGLMFAFGADILTFQAAKKAVAKSQLEGKESK